MLCFQLWSVEFHFNPRWFSLAIVIRSNMCALYVCRFVRWYAIVNGKRWNEYGKRKTFFSSSIPGSRMARQYTTQPATHSVSASSPTSTSKSFLFCLWCWCGSPWLLKSATSSTAPLPAAAKHSAVRQREGKKWSNAKEKKNLFK